ncbi:MAG: helicase-exonuclease AddAB subunit AddA [Bacillaceae bacterium]
MELLPKPSDVKWTDDQWKAIVATGKDILVAAAAGSGKTAVLVERIIKKLLAEENPIDVDRLLIVTFTNAAAQEMKSRIGEAIEEELKKDPTSTYLRKQLLLLNRASISTLHSFCLDVIRKYYYLVQLDPSFRIGNETEVQLIIEEIMEDLLEEQYGSEDPARFFALVDSYTSDRNDSAIQGMVLKLFNDSRAHPSPTKWLHALAKSYDVENKGIEDIVYFDVLLKDVKLQLEGVMEKLQMAIRLASSPLGAEKRRLTIEQDLAVVMPISENISSWKTVYEMMKVASFSKLASVSKKDILDEALDNRIKELRKSAIDDFKKIKEAYFTRTPNQYIKDLEKIKPHVDILVQLVEQFSERFELAKKEKAMVDFSDLEHYCLRIFEENPEVAKEYKAKFEEVLVDEYQDTNGVQEAILKHVTRNEFGHGNMFMVGDVKQSIYGFRLAEPQLFLDKYKRYDVEGRGEGLRIDLNQNFRSRQEVLDATNFIFKQVMDERVGEIYYDDAAELKLGNRDYAESNLVDTEFVVITKQCAEDTNEEKDEIVLDYEELETVQMEARFIATKIKELVEGKFQVYDKTIKANRPLLYRDCVILLRSMPWATQIMEEFKQIGIPLYAEVTGGYLESTEIAIMLNLLRIIDNPHQDIPLASVLRSPIVRLSDSDLAQIRIEHRKGSFYDAVVTFSKEGKAKRQVELFLNQLKKWRQQAQSESLGEFIWRLFRETGYYDFVGGLAGGKQRQANLRMLYERARQFEHTSFRGLYRFLRFIERLEERGEDLAPAKTINEQENVVRLMTIHKSKGLEFPVVFVAGLNRQFNKQDLNEKYLLHREYGFGAKYIDPNLRITYPSIAYHAIKSVKKAELIAEEMRVLYVALTRAKEKLFLVGTVSDGEKAIGKWQQIGDTPSWLLPDYIRSNAKSYLEWIGPALIRHQHSISFVNAEIASPSFVQTHDAKFKMMLVYGAELQGELEKEEERNERLEAIRTGKEVDEHTSLQETIEKSLNWTYGHHIATISRAKQSVSDLKRLSQKLEADERVFSRNGQRITLPRPRFMEAKKITAPERGTAMHAVMQHLNLRQQLTAEDVVEALATMVNKELLTEEESKSILIDEIVAFSESELGERIRNAKHIHKELQFAMMIDGTRINRELEEEEVFVQGIMDCVLEEEDGLVLIDYKTDTMLLLNEKEKEEREAILRERYVTQLSLYKEALQSIWKQPVKASILYFFDGNQVIHL